MENRPTFRQGQKVKPRRLDRRRPEVSRRLLHNVGHPQDCLQRQRGQVPPPPHEVERYK